LCKPQTRIGYIGIRHNCRGHVVANNVLRDTVQTLNDGAAIYTYGVGCGGHVIRDNIIIGVLGNGTTNAGAGSIGAGIYLVRSVVL